MTRVPYSSLTQTNGRSPSVLEVDGKKVVVRNLNKIFYPKTGFTKGDVINYYIKISSVLLPHLECRPISLKRYPEGVTGSFFYEKQCPSHRPKWIKTVRVKKSDGCPIQYCTIHNLAALIWAANLADLEIHTFLHKAPQLKTPTAIAFDLDPGPPANIVQCCEVALLIKVILASIKLEGFAKTSGSKGLQIYIPLNTAPVTYKETNAFARGIAELLEKEFPKQVISRMKKSLRRGKVFVDWSQNDQAKTTVNVYSLRAKDAPTVSTPVTWEEVERTAKKKSILSFESDEVLDRIEKLGDLFAPVIKMKQKLPPFTFLARRFNSERVQ
ncbi:MAG: ATP-dependent DNA ligase [Verrucomicrobia bacterium]|nr:MAG: ATP-dependent DNA ligase [Verrucomicrobiota bacterium]